MIRLLSRVLLGTASVFILYILIVFFYGWITDWVPEEKSTLEISGNVQDPIVSDSLLTAVIWNIGYGGLGAKSDFFFDDEGMWYSGNSMVRSPENLVQEYTDGILDFLRNTPVDFFLLQEVDLQSKRSYYQPQFKTLHAAIPNYSATLALNYSVDRVPIPLLEPWNAYGEVRSGVATFSRFKPKEAIRYQLPGRYPLPTRLFQLDRCAALHRFSTKKGGDLVVINIHNSAYDPGDKLKSKQLAYLKELANKEYLAGNYVIIGGDWNQWPPFFRFDTFRPSVKAGYEISNIPDTLFAEDWRFAFDATVATNRKAADLYDQHKTFQTLIDFFLVSPNVRIKSVKAINQNFAFSDHQPVFLEIELQ